MSGCMHMNPLDWCLSCAPEKAKLWRERAEAELVLKDIHCVHGEAGVSCGMNLNEDYACASCYSTVKHQRDLLREGLAEAREDIKALATICQALGERRIIACAAHTEGDWHAWQRIRDRRLLEVSE